MSFVAACEQYCITSQSVTVELVAPAVSDQGTITAVQMPFKHRTNMAVTQALWGSAPSTCYALQNSMYPSWPIVTHDPVPNENQVLSSTRAYTSVAKQGVYVPLRLGSFKMRNVNNDLALMDVTMELSDTNPDVAEADAGRLDYWAYNYMPPLDNFCSSTINIGEATPQNYQMYLPTYGSNVGIVYINGCSSLASLRIRIRQTLEMKVRPGTTYASLAEAPIPPDELALKMYREVAARMKDAYPASYNDWAKLKEVIKRTAKTLLPAVDPLVAFLTRGLPFGQYVRGGVGLVTDWMKKGLQGVDPYFEWSAQIRDIRKQTASAQGAAKQAEAAAKKANQAAGAATAAAATAGSKALVKR